MTPTLIHFLSNLRMLVSLIRRSTISMRCSLSRWRQSRRRCLSLGHTNGFPEQNPIHFVQCLMWAASRSRPVGAGEKVRLIDGVEQHYRPPSARSYPPAPESRSLSAFRPLSVYRFCATAGHGTSCPSASPRALGYSLWPASRSLVRGLHPPRHWRPFADCEIAAFNASGVRK